MEQLQSDYHRIENPQLSLYLDRKEKSLTANRVSDNTSIATTFIRDFTQLIGCHWDKINGRYLSLVFKDGSVRINDIFNDGKLIAFLRTNATDIDCSYWDRIEEIFQDDNMVIEADITKLMPSLIKFVGDNRSFSMIPYVSSTNIWRTIDKRITKNRILDVHLLHKKTSDELVIILDCDYNVKKSLQPTTRRNKDNGNELCKILNIDRGKYDFWYTDGHIKTISILPIVENRGCMNLLENVLELRDMNKYIKYHIDILEREIIKPYLEFLNRICQDAYGNDKLFEDLRELLLLGVINDELSDWLHYTIGERNLLQWKQFCFDTYQKSNEVLTLSFLPVFERMIILSERCQGLIMSFNKDQMMECDEINLLILKIQNLLKITVENITQTIRQFDIIKMFMNWLNDQVMLELDEEHIPKIKYETNSQISYKLTESFKILFKDNDARQVFNKKKYDTENKKLTELLDKINDNYIQPQMVNQITETNWPPLSLSKEINKILDVMHSVTDQCIILVYLTSNRKKTNHVRIGIVPTTAATTANTQRSLSTSILVEITQTTQEFDSYTVTGARLARNASRLTLLLQVEESPLYCEIPFSVHSDAHNSIQIEQISEA